HWKYVHYVGLPPQLFNLADDPEERQDLGVDPAHADIRRDLEVELRAVCDPDAVDARAKTDQAAVVERHGGRDAVVKRGGFGATPPPGEKPEYAAGQ
ncbi:MAG: sulfatase, partial [Rhodospirillaceae bacterium]